MIQEPTRRAARYQRSRRRRIVLLLYEVLWTGSRWDETPVLCWFDFVRSPGRCTVGSRTQMRGYPITEERDKLDVLCSNFASGGERRQKGTTSVSGFLRWNSTRSHVSISFLTNTSRFFEFRVFLCCQDRLLNIFFSLITSSKVSSFVPS